jgi:hypothetical protein
MPVPFSTLDYIAEAAPLRWAFRKRRFKSMTILVVFAVCDRRIAWPLACIGR